jgi:hypothetical protein
MEYDDDEMQDQAPPPEEAPPETYGSEAMKGYYKALRKAMHTARKGMERLDESPVKAHLDDHLNAMQKACMAMRKAHTKWYPKALMDDDEVIDKSFGMDDAEDYDVKDMSALDATDGGALVGDEPDGDEPDGDEYAKGDLVIQHEDDDDTEMGQPMSAIDMKGDDMDEDDASAPDGIVAKSLQQIRKKQKRLAQLLSQLR